MPRTNFRNEIDKEMKRHYEACQQIGARLHTEVLIPLCKKHKLSFWANDGDYVIVDSSGHRWLTRPDLVDHEIQSIRLKVPRRSTLGLAALEEIQRLHGLLMLEFAHNDFLFQYVANVDHQSTKSRKS